MQKHAAEREENWIDENVNEEVKSWPMIWASVIVPQIETWHHKFSPTSIRSIIMAFVNVSGSVGILLFPCDSAALFLVTVNLPQTSLPFLRHYFLHVRVVHWIRSARVRVRYATGPLRNQFRVPLNQCPLGRRHHRRSDRIDSTSIRDKKYLSCSSSQSQTPAQQQKRMSEWVRVWRKF